MKALLLSVLLSASCAALPAAAQSQHINRCTDASGQSVFTDRACDSLGARSRLPPVPTAGNTLDRDQLGARCPRRLSELVMALRVATGSNDVNRLSSLYLWGAVSDAGAQRVLGQLESIARRPLVDVLPVYPQRPEYRTPASAAATATATATAPMMDGSVAVAGTAQPSTETAPPPAQPLRPIGLRLEQTLPGSATRAATVLGLRRQYGCFWITL